MAAPHRTALLPQPRCFPKQMLRCRCCTPKTDVAICCVTRPTASQGTSLFKETIVRRNAARGAATGLAPPFPCHPTCTHFSASSDLQWWVWPHDINKTQPQATTTVSRNHNRRTASPGVEPMEAPFPHAGEAGASVLSCHMLSLYTKPPRTPSTPSLSPLSPATLPVTSPHT